jgi:DNA-binding transcriptional LysR family regulator
LAVVEFRARLPEVELSVSMVEPPGVVATLRSGEVDLALCNDESVLEQPDVDGVLLFEEPMLVALPSHHRLANRRRLRLGELADERWMLGTDHACPDADRFVRACHAEGFDPKIAFHHDDYTAILGFVGAGMGAAPVPDMIARKASPDVRICTLLGVRLMRPIVAVMPAGYQSRPARAMVDVLEAVSAEWQAAGGTVAPAARTRAA